MPMHCPVCASVGKPAIPAQRCEHILLAELVAVLREIVGQAKPNRWGYDAADVALRDDWRQRARAVLARVDEPEGCTCGEAYGRRAEGASKCAYCVKGVE
jgi:hypothetical protein